MPIQECKFRNSDHDHGGLNRSSSRKNPDTPKPTDGQVHPTARSLIPCRPNFSMNRSSVHSKVSPSSILEKQSQHGAFPQAFNRSENQKSGPSPQVRCSNKLESQS
jgi:hypothetical protein